MVSATPGCGMRFRAEQSRHSPGARQEAVGSTRDSHFTAGARPKPSDFQQVRIRYYLSDRPVTQKPPTDTAETPMGQSQPLSSVLTHDKDDEDASKRGKPRWEPNFMREQSLLNERDRLLAKKRLLDHTPGHFTSTYPRGGTMCNFSHHKSDPFLRSLSDEIYQLKVSLNGWQSLREVWPGLGAIPPK